MWLVSLLHAPIWFSEVIFLYNLAETIFNVTRYIFCYCFCTEWAQLTVIFSSFLCMDLLHVLILFSWFLYVLARILCHYHQLKFAGYWHMGWPWLWIEWCRERIYWERCKPKVSFGLLRWSPRKSSVSNYVRSYAQLFYQLSIFAYVTWSSHFTCHWWIVSCSILSFSYAFTQIHSQKMNVT